MIKETQIPNLAKRWVELARDVYPLPKDMYSLEAMDKQDELGLLWKSFCSSAGLGWTEAKTLGGEMARLGKERTAKDIMRKKLADACALAVDGELKQSKEN